MKRREVLLSAGVMTSAFLAGCVTEDSPAATDDSELGSGEPSNDSSEEQNSNEAGSNDQNTVEHTSETDEGDNENGAEGSDDKNGTTGDTDSGDTDSESEETAAEIADTRIETTDTSCGGGVERSDWHRDGQQIVLTGTVQAPTPCHEAVLADSSLQGGVLQAVIGLEPVGRECLQCVGSINYTATVTVTGGTRVEDVEVDHSN